MSVVTSAVIVVSYAPREVEPLLTEPQLWGRAEGYAQGFAEIDATRCGGGKVLQSDIYAAGFNHIGTEALAEWFRGLPWGDVGQAVLIYDTEGQGQTVLTTPGWDREDEW